MAVPIRSRRPPFARCSRHGSGRKLAGTLAFTKRYPPQSPSPAGSQPTWLTSKGGCPGIRPVARFTRIAHNGRKPPRRARLVEPETDSWTFSPRAAHRRSGNGAGAWTGTTQGCAPLVFGQWGRCVDGTTQGCAPLVFAWAGRFVCAPPWALLGGAFSAVFDFFR